MKNINIKFRDKILEIENKSKSKTAFTTDWNNYKIRLRKYKNAFRVCVTSPKEEKILADCYTTMESGMKAAFEAIDTDISEMEYITKEKVLLLASTKGSFTPNIKRAEEILASISY